MTLYYQDDYITLYIGDCREKKAWLECDVLVTDPPYGISWMKNEFDSDKIKRDAVRERRKLEGGDIANDHDTSARDDVLKMWGKQKAAVVFGTWRKPRPDDTAHRLIWHKMGRYSGVNPHPWFPNDEEIYLIGKGMDWQANTYSYQHRRKPSTSRQNDRSSDTEASWTHGDANQQMSSWFDS